MTIYKLYPTLYVHLLDLVFLLYCLCACLVAFVFVSVYRAFESLELCFLLFRVSSPYPGYFPCVPVSVCFPECMFVFPIVCLFSRVYACFPECMFVFPSVCLFSRVYVCFPECLSVSLSVCSFLEVSVCYLIVCSRVFFPECV